MPAAGVRWNISTKPQTQVPRPVVIKPPADGTVAKVEAAQIHGRDVNQWGRNVNVNVGPAVGKGAIKSGRGKKEEMVGE